MRKEDFDLQFDIQKNGVANLVFDLKDEKINKLSEKVLLQLEKALNVIDGNKAIRLLLISSAKDGMFIAGADINEIKDITNKKDAHKKVSRGQKILNKLAGLKIPTICLIEGACMGGGLELALACDYRIGVVSDKTKIGLPEVKLGIIPGFGGTQRLPQLVGVEEALKMILAGGAIDANRAFKIGLVDDIVRKEFLEEKVSHFVKEMLLNGKKSYYEIKRQKIQKKRKIVENLLLKKWLIFYFAKKNLLKNTKGKYPAPLAALEVIKKTYGFELAKNGFEVELDAFCELAVGDISKNLIDLFFTMEMAKKDLGGDEKFFDKNYFVKNVSLLGAGVMGGGIAWLFADNGINVRLKDITNKAIALGYEQVDKIYQKLIKKRKIDKDQASLKKSRITSTLDYSGFKKSDLVVEAVVENIEIKKKILAEVEKEVSDSALIASNTSSLSISKMAESLKNPERFLGMHFFNPVDKMPLVEVIRGEKTAEENVVKMVQIVRKLGKTPVVVKDVAGFLVNRVLLPFMNEAAYLLEEGAKMEKIDDLIEDFGMPMGPFVLADVVGIDVGVKVAISLQEAYGERMKVCDGLMALHSNHKELLGKKSGKGFYIYDKNGQKQEKNPEIDKIFASKGKFVSDEEVVERCILTMCNEAAKCLEEGVAQSPRHIDLAMIFGTGFPPFRGGIFKYIDQVGVKNVVARLEKYNEKVGKRFEVAGILREKAKKGQGFY